MTNTPGILSLLHALDTCLGHGQALREALDDLDLGRLLDQFAYRYSALSHRLKDCLSPFPVLKRE